MDILKHLPNCVVASTVSQAENEAAWIKARTAGIGGSDIGAICGVSNFSTARTIYLAKTAQYTDTEYVNEFSDVSKERMHFGHVLEPIVADEFVRRTGRIAVEAPATFAHKDFPWARANVDRFLVDEAGVPYGILECKTTDARNFTDWDEGDLPMSYIYQLNWYLWITGLTYGAFACLIGGNRFVHIEVIRNDELLNTIMIPAADKFWNYNVKNLIEPDLTGSGADSDLIKETYTDVEKGSEIVLDQDDVNELAAFVAEGKMQLKELEKQVEAGINKLKERLQNNEIGYTTDHVIKWSPRKTKRVDTELLKKLYPDVYQSVLKESSFRVFTIK